MELENQNIEKNLIHEISNPIYQSKSWIKFLGILMLIYGIFIALSIVGIIIAWLPIWLGILLMQVASRIEQAQQMSDKVALIKAQSSLSTYFTVYGVLALIGLIFFAVLVIVFFATGMMYNFKEFIPEYY